MRSIRSVSYRYSNTPDQHQAEGLLRMVQGVFIGLLVGVIFLSIDPPEQGLFTIAGYVISPARISYITMMLSSLVALVRVGTLLNVGQLKRASWAYVLNLTLIAAAAVITQQFNSMALIAFTLPVTAAGVLLNKREFTRVGIGIVALVIVMGIAYRGGLLGTYQLELLVEEAMAYGAIVLFLNIQTLRVFSAGRLILLEERLLLMDKLEASLAQIQDLNHGLEQRVKDRTRDLEIAREEAERANTVKSQFLAAMSHELRTPLNGIINFTGFVADGLLGEVNEKQTEILKEAIKSAEHLLALINDVLDISKIESGSLRLFVEDNVDLKSEIQTIIMTAEGLVHNKPVTIVTEIDPALPALRGDKRRLRQVMLNIVSNACKFTEEGSVTIRAHVENNEIIFSVKDTGPGITPEDHEAVFETFRQTETGLRNGNGTGLGMPISRRLTEAHGGRLWLESEQGKGATFYVALPLHAELALTV